MEVFQREFWIKSIDRLFYNYRIFFMLLDLSTLNYLLFLSNQSPKSILLIEKYLPLSFFFFSHTNLPFSYSTN